MNSRILKSADSGNVYAMLAAAYMCQKNNDADPESAVAWYIKSARRGCARAKWELAKMYRDGDGVEPDGDLYIEYLTQAADAGIPEAARELSQCYLYGRNVEKDVPTAIGWIRIAVDRGDPMSMFYLALYCESEIGGEEVSTSRSLFKRVVDHGDAAVIYKIGRMYEFGTDYIRKDMDKAASWYRKSATMGCDRAILSYNRLMLAIGGDRPDTREERDAMFALLPSVAEKAELDHMVEKAGLFMDEGDVDDALDIYEEAADRGSNKALSELARIYHEGEVVRKNDSISIEYLERGALGGSGDCYLELGRAYRSGKVLKRDKIEAIRYFAMAAAAGNLIGYFELTRYMDRPEEYVRMTQRIVRRWDSRRFWTGLRPGIPGPSVPSVTSISKATAPRWISTRRSYGSTWPPTRGIPRANATPHTCSCTPWGPTPIWKRPSDCTRIPRRRDTSSHSSTSPICIRTDSASNRIGRRLLSSTPVHSKAEAYPHVTVSLSSTRKAGVPRRTRSRPPPCTAGVPKWVTTGRWCVWAS